MPKDPTALDATPRVGAVVLAFGAPRRTLRALRSLLAGGRRPDMVVVVDNDPARSCEAPVAALGAAATYLPTGANLGFSAGMNRGIGQLLERGADRILIVNNDVEAPAGTLERLLGALDAHPETGLVAPLLVALSDPGLVASAGFAFTPATGRARQIGFGDRLERLAPPAWREVTAASGCFLLVRREVFETAGAFDESFFFSFEDLELCLRARRHGFGVGVAGDAIVLHEGGASIADDSPLRLYFGARNQLLAADRAAPLRFPPARWLRRLCIVLLNVAHALRADDGPLLRRLGAVAAGTRDYFAGRLGAAGRAPETPSTDSR